RSSCRRSGGARRGEGRVLVSKMPRRGRRTRWSLLNFPLKEIQARLRALAPPRTSCIGKYRVNQLEQQGESFTGHIQRSPCRVKDRASTSCSRPSRVSGISLGHEISLKLTA